MLDSRVKPTCIVARAAWGQFLPQQAGGPLSLNGQGIQFIPQGMEARHHELRVYDSMDYTLYCVFCGEIGAQAEWVELIGKLGKVNG